MKTFTPGDRVHVAGLGTGIVREVRNGGRYLIDVKGQAMVVAGRQLEPAAPARVHPAQPPAESASAAATVAAPSGPLRSLDLHGKTVIEAIDVLDAFLNDALLDGVDAVCVIHGRSGGTLKAAVHRRLAQLPTVRAFRVDPKNPGVTVVRL